MRYPASLEDKFTFGKCKGKSVEDVCDNDPSYVKWCIENVNGFELDNEAYEYWEREYHDWEHDRIPAEPPELW